MKSSNQSTILNWIKALFKRNFSHQASLRDLANRYEQELCSKTLVYTFQAKGKKPFTVPISFEPSAFCHLFSIGSIVKEYTPDIEQFSGIKGWKNIQEERITFAMLKQINPSGLSYYANEYEMFNQLLETLANPQAIQYDPTKVPQSKLAADIILFKTFGNRTIHVCLSKEKNSSRWFVRSYFVRKNDEDKLYPSQYIANMTPLLVKVSSKIA